MGFLVWLEGWTDNGAKSRAGREVEVRVAASSVHQLDSEALHHNEILEILAAQY